MLLDSEYQKITKDIAGARTKSRFTYEIAHGVNLIYEEYQKDGEFFIIFDYACDIEKGRDDKISFYQLKTKDKGTYTIDSLITPGKKTYSILQTLVNLKRSNNVDKLYIVSNTRLSGEGTVVQNKECVCFDDLSDDTKKKINSKIVWPLGVPDFKNLFFCVSDIMLKSSENSLIGLTDKFLNNVFPASYTNPSSFKTSIMNFAREKADYDFETSTLEETIEKKGVTRKDVEKLLQDYRKGIIQSVIPPFNAIKNWIDNLKLNTKLAINVKNNYMSRFGKAYTNPDEKELLSMLKNDYMSIYSDLSPTDAIHKTVENFPKNDIVTSVEDKYLFAIMAFENGGI